MPRWLLWTAAAVLSWGVWAVLGKAIGNDLTPAQQQMISTLGFLPVMLALGLSRKRLVRTGRRWGIVCAVAAGAVSGLGNLPYYDLIGREKAAVVPLTALYPLVTIALAVLVLRERVNRIQVVGLLLSLVAIYLFNATGGENEGGLLSGWLAYAFLPMALWGVAGFLSKLATGHLSGELAALLLLIGSTLVGGVLLVIEPLPADLSPRLWVLVLALGLTVAFGNYAIVAAYTTGKASVIAPLGGLYPVVSVPLAVLLFGESIDLRAGVGIACAVLAVLALSFETPSPAQQSHV